LITQLLAAHICLVLVELRDNPPSDFFLEIYISVLVFHLLQFHRRPSKEANLSLSSPLIDWSVHWLSTSPQLHQLDNRNNQSFPFTKNTTQKLQQYDSKSTYQGKIGQTKITSPATMDSFLFWLVPERFGFLHNGRFDVLVEAPFGLE